MQEWVDRWDRDHPDLAGKKRNRPRSTAPRRNDLGQLTAIGAVTILHERTQQLDPDERGVSTDSLRKLLDGRAGPFTELRTADLIVSAIERPDVFHDGTLPVMPNPIASASARASCCGGASANGSLNGSLGV